MTLTVAIGLALLGWAGPADGQTVEELSATPESTATSFLRSVRAIRWDVAARFVHPETLAGFEATVTMIADADETGEARRFLTGTDSLGLAALEPGEIFGRALGALVDDMPGLMHALFDRDDEVLGHVIEGDGMAHVVYRSTARISGAVSEVKVMQLLNTASGWRVYESDELEVLDVALRGIAR